MRGESESWFSSLWWRSSRGNASRQEKVPVGILAFEVAGLMSKIVSLWNCLSDRQIARLKDEIANSPGIIRFVSDDEVLLMELALSEVLENLVSVARPVARLGKKCSDPVYHRLEQTFTDPDDNVAAKNGWEFKWKKMEREVRKMEKFVAFASQLYQEMEVLVDLEHTFSRMQNNPETSPVKVMEYQQKVMWQRHEVKNLQQLSPWNRNFDYVVRLLVKSLFTIFERLKFVAGVHLKRPTDAQSILGEQVAAGTLPRSRSLVQSSIHPSEDHASIFYSGPLAGSSSKLGLTFGYRNAMRKIKLAQQQTSAQNKRSSLLKTKGLTHVGPFKGCMLGGKQSPVAQNCILASSDTSIPPVTCSADVDKKAGLISGHLPCSNSISHVKASILSSSAMFSGPPPGTLGQAALSLHYSNVIILIKKLAACPHLISPDARDDLYSSLPTCIKISLRAKLKSYAKNSASPVYDPALAADWSMAITRILDWLSPLAHSMVRWQSEQSHEKQHMVPRTSILLVQTLDFANQVKIEAAITELLMGLNYLSRFSKEDDDRALFGSADSRAFDGCAIQGGIIACNA